MFCQMNAKRVKLKATQKSTEIRWGSQTTRKMGWGNYLYRRASSMVCGATDLAFSRMSASTVSVIWVIITGNGTYLSSLSRGSFFFYFTNRMLASRSIVIKFTNPCWSSNLSLLIVVHEQVE